MSREIPTLNEMLKLYSKKDLWDRIQEKNKLLDQRNHELAELKKALELACEPRDDWGGCEYDDPYTNYYDYFIDKAKEMLKDDNRTN